MGRVWQLPAPPAWPVIPWFRFVSPLTAQKPAIAPYCLPEAPPPGVVFKALHNPAPLLQPDLPTSHTTICFISWNLLGIYSSGLFL